MSGQICSGDTDNTSLVVVVVVASKMERWRKREREQWIYRTLEGRERGERKGRVLCVCEREGISRDVR